MNNTFLVTEQLFFNNNVIFAHNFSYYFVKVFDCSERIIVKNYDTLSSRKIIFDTRFLFSMVIATRNLMLPITESTVIDQNLRNKINTITR